MFSNSLGTKRWFPQVVTVMVIGFILGLLVIAPSSVAAQGPVDDGHDTTAARYTALAEFYGVQRGLQVDAARYNGLAEFYSVQRGLDTTAARYTAMAEHYGIDDGVQRGLQADAARYNALADYYSPLLTMR